MSVVTGEKDPKVLEKIVQLLNEALELMDEQGLDLAAAQLDLCCNEVRTSLDELQARGT